MTATVYAGAAKRVVTPDLHHNTVYLAGFQSSRRATAVHDNLYARALTVRLDDGNTDPDRPECFTLVVCDLIGILHADVLAIRRAVRQYGVDTRALVVASTHVHSGPDTIGMWGPSRFRSGVDRRYQEFLCQQIVDAIAEATENLSPARLWAGSTELGKWLRNARQPHIVDRELSVLQATTGDGQPIFTLVNLACHPEVMFGENTAITADYAGATCQEIDKQVGGIGILASADIGGMMTPDVDKHERNFGTVQRMGQDVASAAFSALEGGQTIEPARWRFCRRDVRIPLDNPLFKFALSIGLLPSLRRDGQGGVSTQVSLLDLGAARLVTIPGELFPRPGMHLRHLLGVPYRFLIGLADDELGYLLPYDEFIYPRNPLKPGEHYEETMSLSKYATPILMEAWAALLAGCLKEKR